MVARPLPLEVKMSALTNLKEYYLLEAAKISDAGDMLECLAAIDRWYDCRVAVDALSSTDVVSYSVGGRSVTRKSLPELRDQEAVLLQEVKMWIGRGGGGLVDISSGEAL